MLIPRHLRILSAKFGWLKIYRERLKLTDGQRIIRKIYFLGDKKNQLKQI